MMRLCIRKSRKSTNFIKLAVILYREGIVAYAIPVATSHHMYAATVALSSEQSPQTPAYASTQNSKKYSPGIYFVEGFCT